MGRLGWISCVGLFCSAGLFGGCGGELVEICNDAVDNDQDGFKDCSDPDCAAECAPTTSTSTGTPPSTPTTTPGTTTPPTLPTTTTPPPTETGDTGTTVQTITYQGAVRVVDLIEVPGQLAIYDIPATQATTATQSIMGGTSLVYGQNSDANSDYFFATPHTASWSVVDWSTGLEIFQHDPVYTLGEYHTELLVGEDPAGGFNPGAFSMVDDHTPAAAGTHRLTLIHVGSDSGAANVVLSGASTVNMSYLDTYQVVLASGPQALGLDTSGTQAPEHSFTMDLADGEWSYMYLLETAPTSGELNLAMHHVRGSLLQVLPP